LPETIAVKIITRMKPKKAGSVMAYIEPKKAALLTESMAKFENNFPPE
jgi:flagellar motility protein MotE (MotC chaperone)